METYFKKKLPVFAIVFVILAILAANTLVIAIPIQNEGIHLPKSGEMILRSEKDIPNHIWVAGQYLKSGKFNDVITICEQVLSIKKDNIDAHAHMAAAYKGLGKQEEFKKETDLLKKLSPNSPALHLSLAATYLYFKDFEKAKSSYQNGLKLAPDKTEIRMKLGALYLKNKKLKEASDQYLQALKKKNLSISHFVNANYALCEIGLMNKEFDEVIKRARMITDLYPLIDQSYNFLAYAFIGKGESKKAISAYELLRKNNPNSPVPYQELPLIYADKLNDTSNALKIAQEGVKKFPENAKSLNVFGWILYKAKHFSEAIESFEKARTLAPKDPLFMYHLGLVLQESGEKDNALSLFKKALELVNKEKQEDFFMELKKRVEQSL